MQFWQYTIVLQKHFVFVLLLPIPWLAFGNTLMKNEPKLIRNFAFLALYNCLAEVFYFCSSTFNSLDGLWKYSHAKWIHVDCNIYLCLRQWDIVLPWTFLQGPVQVTSVCSSFYILNRFRNFGRYTEYLSILSQKLLIQHQVWESILLLSKRWPSFEYVILQVESCDIHGFLWK